MVTSIRIADHVEHASTYQDGQVIYDLILEPMRAGDVVEISFAGIAAVPSAFINSALVQLTEVLPVAAIRQRLRIVDSTRYINDMIRTRFAFVERMPPEVA
jgi:hypothetical protein